MGALALIQRSVQLLSEQLVMVLLCEGFNFLIFLLLLVFLQGEVAGRNRGKDVEGERGNHAECVQKSGATASQPPDRDHVIDRIHFLAILRVVLVLRALNHAKKHGFYDSRPDQPKSEQATTKSIVLLDDEEDPGRHPHRTDYETPDQDAPFEVVVPRAANEQEHVVEEEKEADKANYVRANLHAATAEHPLFLCAANSFAHIDL